MHCPDSEQLGEFAAGQLAARLHEEIDAHLELCPQCQTQLDRLGRETILDSLPLSAPPPDAELTALIERAKCLRSANDQPKDSLQAGDRLGEYEIVGPIGSGGVGQVYLALHRRMQRQVAIKLLSPRWLQTEQATKRFQREIEAVAKLDHPNVVTAYDAGEVDRSQVSSEPLSTPAEQTSQEPPALGAHSSIIYLVMEFVDGETLQSRISRGVVTPAEVISVGRQAAAGLLAAHQAGLVHRDVKPSNLIRDDQGNVKVLDLGLARPLSTEAPPTHLTDSQHCMGTPDYMAPEQATNPKQAGPAADVYSLGCTLFHLLQQRKPFAGETPIEVILNHREQPPPIATKGDLRLGKLIRRMMAKRESDRPSMAEVLSQLESLESTDSRLSSHSHDHSKVFWWVGAAMVLLIIALAAWPPANVDSDGESQATKAVAPTDLVDGAATSAHPSPPRVEMIAIKPGKFRMGSPPEHPRASIDEQPHEVELTQPFALGKFEVTEGLWREVTGDEPPQPAALQRETPSSEEPEVRDQLPVQGLRWLDAVKFCNAVSNASGFEPFYEIEGAQVRILGGHGYRLPTEAEWEYACRAGGKEDWHFGEDETRLDDYAWHAGNSKHRQMVGQKLPNPWGLHDMHGNVPEWCWDRYDAEFFSTSPAINPVGSGKGGSRVFRGGAWYDNASQTRSAARGAVQMTYGRYQPVGLRLARTMQP